MSSIQNGKGSLVMDDFVKKVIEFGALSAKMIKPESVVTAPWVIFKCKYGCSNYNKRQCCPPISPTWNETRLMLDECYSDVLLIQCLDPYTVNDVLRKMLDWLGAKGYYKALGFGAKKCEICRDLYDDECGFPNCKHADQVIPQMDGAGIDVIQTVVNNGYDEDGVMPWGDSSGFKVRRAEDGGKDWSATGIRFYGMIMIQ